MGEHLSYLDGFIYVCVLLLYCCEETQMTNTTYENKTFILKQEKS